MSQGNKIESSVVVFTHVGMDSSGSAKLQRAEQQLSAVTSGALYKHSVHKEKINEDKDPLVEVEVEVESTVPCKSKLTVSFESRFSTRSSILARIKEGQSRIESKESRIILTSWSLD